MFIALQLREIMDIQTKIELLEICEFVYFATILWNVCHGMPVQMFIHLCGSVIGNISTLICGCVVSFLVPYTYLLNWTLTLPTKPLLSPTSPWGLASGKVTYPVIGETDT